MLTLYKASAGSGKTYTLTKEYLFLLFKNEMSFRNTLAVTFTNKASQEMKERILSHLHILSDGASSPYMSELMEKFALTQVQVNEKAQSILHAILHNYSQFYVETIDSFFQKILRQFTRELGLNAGFSIELDNAAVLNKVIDSLFIELEKYPDFQKWLQSYSEEKIEAGEKIDFRKELNRLGYEIFKENFNEKAVALSVISKDKKQAKLYFNKLNTIKEDFENKLKEISLEALSVIEKNNLTIDDFSYKKSSFVNTFNKFLSKDFKEPGKRFIDALDSIDSWCTKKSEKLNEIQAAFDSGLNACIAKVLQVFDTESRNYNSARAVLDYKHTLAVLADISEMVLRYCEEENIFLLSNNNYLINEIINNNDTPFIYEKIGAFLNNIMIDEFQDTSVMQWLNFKPLVENSLSVGGKSLIVGDVKQSIYRWRNGDWKLLGEEVPRQFYNQIEINNLEINWRSSRNVIAFNNSLFQNAALYLQNNFNGILNDSAPDLLELYSERISQAYSGLIQNIPNHKADDGIIKIFNLEPTDRSWKSDVLEKVVTLVEEIQLAGTHPNDIAFLVRNNRDAVILVEYFMDYKLSGKANKNICYDIISSEALQLKRSGIVRFLISILKLYNNYNDDISKAYIKYYIDIKINKGEITTKTFDLGSFDEFWQTLLSSVAATSIYAFIEQCIIYFNFFDFKEEVPFLYTFQNMVIDFEVKNSANFQLFLEYWEEKSDKFYLPLNSDSNSMKLLTIHKSKGLEFKTVIMPFGSWTEGAQHEEIIWCRTEVEPFNQVSLLPVKYKDALKNTIFYKEYFNELFLKKVDTLNLYYVAFTRAIDQLYIFLPQEMSSRDSGNLIIESLKYNIASEIEKKNQIVLTDYLDENNNFSYGTKISIHQEEEKKSGILLESYYARIPSYSIMPMSRNVDFFNDFSPKGERKSYGVLMHTIFEKIKYFEDIDSVLDTFLFQGLISSEEFDLLATKIKKLLSDNPYRDWFSDNYEILTENSIILPKGIVKRPDRIMIKDRNAIVLDYKFTVKFDKKHAKQVLEYKNLLIQMGYSTSAFLWYVDENNLFEV